MKLSLCVIVKNEEKRLDNFFNRIKPLVDEIIVVDTGSTDNSVEICCNYADCVIRQPNFESFSDARNESLRCATGDWILVLDIDEFILADDMIDIRAYIENSEVVAYRLGRYNYIGEGMWSTSHSIRLFQNKQYISYTRKVHETIKPSLQGNYIMPIPIYIHHFPISFANLGTKKNSVYIKWMEEHLTNNNDDPIGHALLAIEYYTICEMQKALAEFERAFNIDSESLDVNVFCGFMCYNIKDYKNATKYFNNVIDILGTKLDVRNFKDRAYTGLALTAFAQNEIDLALMYCQREENGSHNSAHTYLNLGIIFKRLGLYYEASNYFNKAIKINPLLTCENIYFAVPDESKCIYSFNNMCIGGLDNDAIRKIQLFSK